MNSAMRLRPAEPGDCERTFTWADDEGTRAGSFRSGRFDLDAHRRWFLASLDGTARRLLIAELDDEPFGLLRFDEVPDADRHDARDTREIGITIAPSHRGRRLALPLLRAGLADAVAHGTTRLIARIRTDNPRSARAFERAGFALVGDEDVAGVAGRRFEWRARTR